MLKKAILEIKLGIEVVLKTAAARWNKICEPQKRFCSLCSQELKNFVKDYPRNIYCPICLSLPHESVEVFTTGYRGTRYKPCVDKENISTDYFKDKLAAEFELKLKASLLDCNVVYNVSFISKKENDGNYYYSVWKAEGMAAQK